jgi:hypothetical protein
MKHRHRASRRHPSTRPAPLIVCAFPLPQVLLLEGGARPELLTVTGKGPMDVARAKGHKECVQLLQVQGRLIDS